MTNGKKFIQTFGNVTSFYDYELDITTIHIDGDWWDAEYKGVDVLDKIRAEILEEKECAYADFDKYKVDYLEVDSRYVEDELPYDDFRYGMERCIEIINKYRNEASE